MLNNILSKLFGIGLIPAEMRASLDGEQIEFLQEKISGSVTLRNYRSPQRIAGWARRGFVGAMALTSRRFVAYGNRICWIYLPFDQAAFRGLKISAKGTLLSITFDVATLFTDRTGEAMLRYNFPQAATIAERLIQRGATAAKD